jgi:hypothetical protein
MSQGTKKKSRLWSLKEIKEIVDIVESAMVQGKTSGAAMDEAAAHFGVSRNAINLRYLRYKKGESMTRVKRNTAKKPTKGMKRGPYKKRRKILKFKEDKSLAAAALAKRIVAESNRLVFPVSLLAAHIPRIKEVIVDFDARSITYTY